MGCSQRSEESMGVGWLTIACTRVICQCDNASGTGPFTLAETCRHSLVVQQIDPKSCFSPSESMFLRSFALEPHWLILYPIRSPATFGCGPVPPLEIAQRCRLAIPWVLSQYRFTRPDRAEQGLVCHVILLRQAHGKARTAVGPRGCGFGCSCVCRMNR